MTAAHRPQLVTLGEALIDFVGLAEAGKDPSSGQAGASPLQRATTFHRAAGGAPANVAVGAARLGTPTGFLGKVGADPFGDFLADTLAAEGVDVSRLVHDPEARTALAFVSLGAEGERDFLFYRRGAADTRLAPDEVDEEYVAGAAVLHIGSLSLTEEPVRSATLRALEAAERNGVARSFDPNLRLDLWESPGAARTAVLELLPRVNLLKLSEDELEFLTGSDSAEAASSLMLDGMELLCVTRGAAGVDYLARPSAVTAGREAPVRRGHVAAFPVRAIDTTGAGDAFVAGLLAARCRQPDLTSDEAALEAALRRAAAYAALTVTRHGAIPALPTTDELERFLTSS